MTAPPWLGAGPAGGLTQWLHADDGVRLRARLWPLARARGTVLILSGRTEYAEKYDVTADWLTGAGFAAATIDWRGQGLSDRLIPDPRKGHVHTFADYQRDLAALRAAVIAQGLPQPWFLLAHSMGGTIGLRALLTGLEVRACAFSAPMWGIHLPERLNGATDRLAGLLVRLGLAERYAPPPGTGAICYQQSAPFIGNVLTGDRATWTRLQKQLRAHPELAIAGPTLGWLTAALTECAALAPLAAPPLPGLAGLGTAEQVVDPAAIHQRMQHWPGGQLHIAPGGRHELLVETPALRDAFRARIIDLFTTA